MTDTSIHKTASVAVPDKFAFEYRHANGEHHTVTVSRKQVIEQMPDFLFEALCDKFCNCESIGETNVVECCCDEYAEEFQLFAAAPHPVSGEQKAVAKPQTCNGKRCGWCGEGQEPCHYQPAPAAQDVAGLVEALEAVVAYDESSEDGDGALMMHYADMLKKVRSALCAYRVQQRSN